MHFEAPRSHLSVEASFESRTGQMTLCMWAEDSGYSYRGCARRPTVSDIDFDTSSAFAKASVVATRGRAGTADRAVTIQLDLTWRADGDWRRTTHIPICSIYAPPFVSPCLSQGAAIGEEVDAAVSGTWRIGSGPARRLSRARGQMQYRVPGA